jgi:hypothetical protein
MLHKHVNIKLILTFTIFLAFTTGCKEDFLYEHELVASSTSEPEEIITPCDYSDEITLEGYSNVTGGLRSPDIRESFDYTEVRSTISLTPNIVLFKINNSFGLDAVKSQVIDYSETSGIVSMNLITYDFSEYSFTRKSGKLYIERINENTLKFTWCDVQFREFSSSSDRKSYGSLLFTYE